MLLLPKYIDVLQDALGLTAFMSDACDIETAPYTTTNEGWNKGMMDAVADPEGVQVVVSKLFHFHGEFSENQEKLIKSQVKLTNQTHLCKYEPPFKESWICHWMDGITCYQIRVYYQK